MKDLKTIGTVFLGAAIFCIVVIGLDNLSNHYGF